MSAGSKPRGWPATYTVAPWRRGAFIGEGGRKKNGQTAIATDERTVKQPDTWGKDQPRGKKVENSKPESRIQRLAGAGLGEFVAGDDRVDGVPDLDEAAERRVVPQPRAWF